MHTCPVTWKDVDIAEKIFGPDRPTLKGRTIWKTPTFVMDEHPVDIPPELLKQKDELTLFLDVMFLQWFSPALTA